MPTSNPHPDTLRIELSVPQSSVAVNAQVLTTAHLVNDGREPVDVVLPGDGSTHGMRSPLVVWSHPPLPGICGNINALRADEVVTLAPGQRVKLEWLGSLQFATPGRRRLQLRLEHDPERPWGGVPLGEHDPAAMARVRQIKPFIAVSNEVEIEVKA